MIFDEQKTAVRLGLEFGHVARLGAQARDSVEAVTEFYQTQILPRSFQRVATGGPGEKINLLMTRVYLSQEHSLPLPKPPRDYPGGYTEVRRVRPSLA